MVDITDPSIVQINATLGHLQFIMQIIQPTAEALGEICLQCFEGIQVSELRMMPAGSREAHPVLLSSLCIKSWSLLRGLSTEQARMCFPSQLRMWPDISKGNKLGIPEEMLLFVVNAVTGKVTIFMLTIYEIWQLEPHSLLLFFAVHSIAPSCIPSQLGNFDVPAIENASFVFSDYFSDSFSTF